MFYKMEDCDPVQINLTSVHLAILYDGGQQSCVNRKVNLMHESLT